MRIAAALLAAALLLGACGGDDDSEDSGGEVTVPTTTPTTAGPEASTEAFASGVCGAITTFSTQARALNDALEVSDEPLVTLDALLATYTQMESVVDGLLSQVSTVPAPAVDGGEDIKAAVVDAYRDLADTVHGVVDDLQAVPAGDEAAAATAIEDAGEAFGLAVDRIGGAVIDVAAEHPEASDALDEAFAAEHACENLLVE